MMPWAGRNANRKAQAFAWAFLKSDAMEATGGFEPPNRGFADPCLRPLGYVALLPVRAFAPGGREAGPAQAIRPGGSASANPGCRRAAAELEDIPDP